MSDATWKIRNRKPVSSEYIPSKDQFQLLVTAKSEHRPGIVHQWQGRINVDKFGKQSIHTITLLKAGRANDPNVANDPNEWNWANIPNAPNEANEANEETSVYEISPMDIDLRPYEIINTTDDPVTLFTRIANFCDQSTQDIERNFVEGEKRERMDKQKLSTTLRRLSELEDEGTHAAAPLPEVPTGRPPHKSGG